jgi:hypothetical protein
MSFCDKARKLAEKLILGADDDKDLDDELRRELNPDDES